jgi:hypothetical protein
MGTMQILVLNGAEFYTQEDLIGPDGLFKPTNMSYYNPQKDSTEGEK